jgi:hypothetical protein
VAGAATEAAGSAHPPHAAERRVRRAIERRREVWPLGKLARAKEKRNQGREKKPVGVLAVMRARVGERKKKRHQELVPEPNPELSVQKPGSGTAPEPGTTRREK